MARRTKGNFTMLAFDGLHGTEGTEDVAVIGAGSLISVLPPGGVSLPTFVQTGITSFTTHEYKPVSAVPVRTLTPTSVYKTESGRYRTAMPVAVTLQEPTRVREQAQEGTTVTLDAGTELALLANSTVEVLEAGTGSTGLLTNSNLATSKTFPWVPVLFCAVVVGVTILGIHNAVRDDSLRRKAKRGGRR